MGNKKNVIVGAAQVFLGPGFTGDASAKADLDAWRPAFEATKKYGVTLSGAAGAAANWSDVGYTQDGLEVATSPTWDEVQVDQLLDSAKIFKSGMSLNITTTFAEATLENLLIAWGQQTSTLSSSGLASGEKELVIEGGSLGEAPVERGLIAIGNAVENTGTNSYGERVYQAYRVLSVESSAHTLSRADATTIPVTFRALPADNGRYGTVRDRLGVA